MLLIQLGLMVFLAAGPIISQDTSRPKREPGTYVLFETSLGKIVCKFYEKEAPETVANFIGLAEGSKEWTHPETGKKMVKTPYFDNTVFHRVIPDFMIQGGDPTGKGTGWPGYTIKDEIVESLKFDVPGRLAMANSGPNTAASQFFITEVPTPHLNGTFTIFGQVVEGQELVGKIARAEEKTKLIKVTIERETARPRRVFSNDDLHATRGVVTSTNRPIPTGSVEITEPVVGVRLVVPKEWTKRTIPQIPQLEFTCGDGPNCKVYVVSSPVPEGRVAAITESDRTDFVPSERDAKVMREDVVVAGYPAYQVTVESAIGWQRYVAFYVAKESRKYVVAMKLIGDQADRRKEFGELLEFFAPLPVLPDRGPSKLP